MVRVSGSPEAAAQGTSSPELPRLSDAMMAAIAATASSAIKSEAGILVIDAVGSGRSTRIIHERPVVFRVVPAVCLLWKNSRRWNATLI
jgi:hypothetical protein